MYLKIKRFIDLILSLVGFLVLLPLILMLSIIIKFTSRGPILFKQKRFGINKKYFYIYKFRTMRIDTPKDCPTHLLENPDHWITSVGKFMRKTSLDELPQLINIIKGEMSIVGPRPALWNQHDLIELRDKYNANSVPVGLTGLAQVSGRDELELEVKARIDGDYAKNISMKLDVFCFIKTIKSVFTKEGIVEGTSKSRHQGGKRV